MLQIPSQVFRQRTQANGQNQKLFKFGLRIKLKLKLKPKPKLTNYYLGLEIISAFA